MKSDFVEYNFDVCTQWQIWDVGTSTGTVTLVSHLSVEKGHIWPHVPLTTCPRYYKMVSWKRSSTILQIWHILIDSMTSSRQNFRFTTGARECSHYTQHFLAFRRPGLSLRQPMRWRDAQVMHRVPESCATCFCMCVCVCVYVCRLGNAPSCNTKLYHLCVCVCVCVCM
jgi:hypothetical protein